MAQENTGRQLPLEFASQSKRQVKMKPRQAQGLQEVQGKKQDGFLLQSLNIV